LQTQRARIAVTPNGDRRYRATVTNPADDPSLRRPDDLVLQAQTTNTAANQPVEISRFYAFDAGNNQYETGTLRGRSVHLPTDIDIAVRQLNVAVVNTLPVSLALPTAPTYGLYNQVPAAIPALVLGGEVFVMVAANVMVPGPAAVEYTSGPAPVGTIDPVIVLRDANGEANAALRAFLGDGRPFGIGLSADDPPEELAGVRFNVTVGEPGNTTTLNVLIPIGGHFLASAPAYTVAVGGTLILTCADLTGAAVTPLNTVGVTLANGTAPPLVGGTDPELTFVVAGNQLTITANAAATPGTRRLLMFDSANLNSRARRTIVIV
jgi:hypothetical protein